MTFIDWSDPEEMLGLLAEYVADERLAEQEDQERRRFLSELTSALTALASEAGELSIQATIDRLRSIRDSQPREFGADSALIHLQDCMQELERIASSG